MVSSIVVNQACLQRFGDFFARLDREILFPPLCVRLYTRLGLLVVVLVCLKEPENVSIVPAVMVKLTQVDAITTLLDDLHGLI